MHKLCIAQLAKAPVLGQVKTRLTTQFSDEQALQIHMRLLEHVAKQCQIFLRQNNSFRSEACAIGGRNVSSVSKTIEDVHKPNTLHVEHELWCSQPHMYFETLLPKYPCRLQYQSGEGLGERLTHCASTVLQQQTSVVLIGSDCPYLDAEIYCEVAKWISQPKTDAVIIPAEDGGFVLLALRMFNKAVFKGVAWSTERVFEQCYANLASLNMRVKVLPPLEDIDRPEDYLHLCERVPSFLLS